MGYDSLRDWLKALDKAGELKRVKAEVSPILEMAEIADRASKSGKGTAKAGGPALLFENVTGYKGARVLMNQFGSERRMKLALEVDSLDDIAKRIETLLHPQAPTSVHGQAEDAADARRSRWLLSETHRCARVLRARK